MFRSLPDPAVLLADAPLGEYLLDQSGEHRTLWRISEGGPGEDALDPVALHPLVPQLPLPLAEQTWHDAEVRKRHAARPNTARFVTRLLRITQGGLKWAGRPSKRAVNR
jgi:hypothetical protein